MDKDLKQKWIDALRSGNYTQGKCALRTANDEYCCLGVLCDLVDSSQWALQEDGKFYAWDVFTGLPPSQWDREILDNQTFTFTRMNDGEEKSFADIADWIEENL